MQSLKNDVSVHTSIISNRANKGLKWRYTRWVGPRIADMMVSHTLEFMPKIQGHLPH